MSQLKASTIGAFIDSVAGNIRTPAAVAGRFIEEAVELGLAAGLTPGQIMGHVMDSLHNQSLKASATQGITVFPSQLRGNISEVGDEAADCALVLDDFSHVSKINLEAEKEAKFSKFVTKTFRVSENGTIYTVKPHVK